MRGGVDETVDPVTAVQQALREADELAARSHFYIGDDGVVRDNAPGGLLLDEHAATDRARMFVERRDRVAQVVRTSTTLASAAFTGMTHTANTTDLAPPPGGPPAANNAYGESLTVAQREDLLSHHADLIGNLDGLPPHVRNEANRTRLPAELAAARAAWDNRSLLTRFE